MNNYTEKFTRGEKHLNTNQLREYSETIKLGSNNPEDTKILNIYRDCFGTHVTANFGAQKNKIELSKQNGRFISCDNLNHVFLNLHYEAPKVNELVLNKNKKTISQFIELITSNPITNYSEQNYDLGTNKVTYLVGDVGTGKSTYISRLLMDLTDTPIVNDNNYRVVPILFDFEIRHKDDKTLKNIDDLFWADLYNYIHDTVVSNSSLNVQVPDEILINPLVSVDKAHGQILHHLKKLIHYLASKKIRLLFIFDNLDRYHFYYTKYSVFEEYEHQQMISVKSNVSALVNTFDKKDLGTSGLCVLIVCRRYLYDYLCNFDDVTPKDNHYRVFTLPSVTAKKVVSSRLALYEKALNVANPVSKAMTSEKFRAFKDIVTEFYEHTEGIKAIKVVSSQLTKANDTSLDPALEAIVKMGHNGFRSLIKFLASLPLRYTDCDVVKRLLVNQPHLLLLLYITNNHQHFTQEEQGHFPNLFLCDCLVSPHREFPNAHLEHRHTYWLKYLILKYLLALEQKEEEEEHCTVSDIINLFAGTNCYEEHLVKLALGSLCTTGEFSCIEIEYGSSNSILASRLSLTSRGKYLVTHDQKLFGSGKPVDFCFNFHYLQLVIDDKLIAIPRLWYKEVFKNSRHSYSYLFLSGDQYGQKAPSVVVTKIEAVFYFLRILEGCLKYEKRGKPELFKKLDKMGVLPNFSTINEEMLSTVNRLLEALNRSGEIERFKELEIRLRYDKSFDDFFDEFNDNSLLVRK
jgi:GTPase SAR1 family protein